jgi:hypothetical protein
MNQNKKLAYTGFISGFYPTIQDWESRNDCWDARSVSLIIDDATIEISFNDQGVSYKCICREIKSQCFQGDVIGSNNNVGKIYFWTFTGVASNVINDMVINGFWNEDNKEYDIWGRFKLIKK